MGTRNKKIDWLLDDIQEKTGSLKDTKKEQRIFAHLLLRDFGEDTVLKVLEDSPLVFQSAKQLYFFLKDPELRRRQREKYLKMVHKAFKNKKYEYTNKENGE